MTIERKVGMGIAGQPSGGPTDVAEVFSTHLYDGTNNAKTITNGIDLAGEGGMVWTKARDGNVGHAIVDTVRGPTKFLEIDTSTEATTSVGITSFNSNGYSLGADNTWKFNVDNSHVSKYASWTFRKKKKFFDVITWTGNGFNGGREIPHNLAGPVGMVIVKTRSIAYEPWYVWHKGAPSKYSFLNTTAAATTTSAQYIFGDKTNVVNPTSSVITVTNSLNTNGGTFVAYVFADNSAEDAEDQMIKCGSGTTDSSDEKCTITLGWEPQFVLVKRTDSSGNWEIYDSMRGFGADGEEANDKVLSANASSSEANAGRGGIHANGFTVRYIGSNADFSYMAIRAPMMVEPEAATDVFHANSSQGAGGGASFYSTGFDVDMAITKITNAVGSHYNGSRLAGGGKFLRTEGTNAEDTGGAFLFDVNDGLTKTGGAANGNDPYVTYMWKRAKGFFDVVAFTGNATAGRAIPHSLGVAPEIVLLKSRGSVQNWYFLNASTGGNFLLNTSSTDQGNPQSYWGNGTNYVAPTASNFTIGSRGQVNASNVGYIAYLFATLAGISKVGSYTGNGSSQTINCGFSAGARFILIKRTNATGNWMLFDTTQGIVAGNDPYVYPDSSSAQITNEDAVDPHSSGFIINQTDGDQNVSNATYIFYAIS